MARQSVQPRRRCLSLSPLFGSKAIDLRTRQRIQRTHRRHTHFHHPGASFVVQRPARRCRCHPPGSVPQLPGLSQIPALPHRPRRCQAHKNRVMRFIVIPRPQLRRLASRCRRAPAASRLCGHNVAIPAPASAGCPGWPRGGACPRNRRTTWPRSGRPLSVHCASRPTRASKHTESTTRPTQIFLAAADGERRQRPHSADISACRSRGWCSAVSGAAKWRRHLAVPLLRPGLTQPLPPAADRSPPRSPCSGILAVPG